ncbi:glutamate racemase [Tissierella sp. Yu-01]|uniref:glutamate racemase n=1 Tax=Tissierella sp. Yu-01 TaxID=3035694 RepID=UPI00240E56DD|nr:glutamate racemase [Tissierella sp. Yu-01]WFA08663.1 glutamate racemase [Tissierella sp. Yu-01]
MNNKPIGIFDSGVGGLTVAKEVVRNLPNEEIIYFGDNGRNPYGVRTTEEIIYFCEQITRFLISHDVKAIIIACNTATIAALDELVEQFDVPIFGVVRPGVSAVIETTKNKRVGLIATESSVKSGSYQRLIKEKDGEIEVFGQACPLLVNIAEECLYETRISYEASKYYLEDLINKGIDTLVLGCTHFPLHRKNIEEVVGERINIVDPAFKTVEGLCEFLEKNNMKRESGIEVHHKIYVSGKTEKFKNLADDVLNGDYNVEKINIEEY